MNMDPDLQICHELKWADVKIMTQASVFVPGEPASVVEIRRGMKITSNDGREAGKVAGVALRLNSREAVCLILSHLPEAPGYQSLPVTWIDRLEGETIVLKASFESILASPGWHVIGA